MFENRRAVTTHGARRYKYGVRLFKLEGDQGHRFFGKPSQLKPPNCKLEEVQMAGSMDD